MSAAPAPLVKAKGSDGWFADIFDMIDGEVIPAMEIAEELLLKDEVLLSLGAQGEVGAVELVDGGDSSDDGGIKKRGRDSQNSTGAPGTQSDGKMKKSQREKLRRDSLNDHFMGLSALLELGSTGALKTDKATIVTEAAKVIKVLRQQLQEKTYCIKEVAEKNSALTMERESILQDKQKIEYQLACFMSSMPFASPLIGGMYHAHPGAPAAISMLKPGTSSPLPGTMFAFPPLVVQTTTADEDAKLRAPLA